jgi:antitoxin component YwqK of YwqJK toxin-antitoxin module
MDGYKIFEPDYTCRGYKYLLNCVNVDNNKGVVTGKSGFHFCSQAINCLKYYKYTPKNTYAKVRSGVKYVIDNDKIVCNELLITKPLTYEEFGKLLTFDVCTPIKKCSYVNGKLNGEYKEWYDNRNLKLESNYVNGELHGKYNEWYDNGKPKVETTYVSGEKHGKYQEWYKNGQLKVEATFLLCEEWHDRRGLRHGIYKEWYENGQLSVETNYKAGEKIKHKVWYENGQLCIEKNYRNYECDGTCRSWYPNGLLNTEENYNNGQLHGTVIYWYNNGQLGSKSIYNYGKRGDHVEYWCQNDSVDDLFSKNTTLKDDTMYDYVPSYRQWYDSGCPRLLIDYENGIYKEWHVTGELKLDVNMINKQPYNVRSEWNIDGDTTLTCELKGLTVIH